MKLRTLLPAVLAAFSTTAFAANVELYGIVDAYVQVYNGGNGTVVDLGSGGKAGSRWGIKGTEDLGGGNSVFFRLENGFMLDNGTNSPATGGNGYAFQRESVLGVKGGWGALSFGRQYTLNFGGIAQFDASRQSRQHHQQLYVSGALYPEHSCLQRQRSVRYRQHDSPRQLDYL